MRPGVVYCIECNKCKATGECSQYWGESARTAHDRGSEHLRGLKNKAEGSALWAYHVEIHKEEEESPDFTMKVYRVVQNTLNRQILEGKKIGAFKGKYPLNGRGEWGENCVPKLTLEEDKPVEKKRHWPPSTATQGRNKRARRCKEREESTGFGDEPHSEPESKREVVRSAREGPGNTHLRSQN